MVQIKAVFNRIDADQLMSQVRSIENELTEPLSAAQCTTLFRRLDTTQQTLKKLQKGETVYSRSQGSELEQIDETIVALFGKISNKAVDADVREIQERAGRIQTALEEGVNPQAEKEILEDQIGELCANHTLSPEYRRIVSWAKATLQGKSSHGTAISHFEWVAAQKPVLNFHEGYELGEIEDLFEIAVLIDLPSRKEAKSRYNQLSETVKRQVKKHLDMLGGELLEDPLETIQALIATAHELAGNFDGYYSKNEVEQFFMERRQICTSDNIFALQP